MYDSMTEQIKRNEARIQAMAKGPESVKLLDEQEFLDGILYHKPRTAAEFVGLILNVGVSRERAIQILQAKVGKRKSILEELTRLQAIESPDEETLQKMEQFAAAVEERLWFPKSDEESRSLSIAPDTSTTACFYFKAVWILYDLGVQDGETVQLSNADFTLTIRRMEKAEHERLHLNFGPHVCEVVCKRVIPEQIREQFLIWINLAMGWKETHPEQFSNGPDAPDAVVEFSRDIVEFTRRFIVYAVSIMVWRLGLSCSSTFIHSEHGLHWSHDGVKWERFYKCLHITSITRIHVAPSFKAINDVQQSIASNAEEPLGSELLREARSIMHTSLRSALIIGMTAAEVGTKQFIAKLVPHLEWLAFNSPSPPLVKILKNYLPTLPLVNQPSPGSPMLPDTLRAGIAKGVELRNDATHQGKKVTVDEVKATLKVVDALLHYLDYYAGHKWALPRAIELTPEVPKKATKKHNPLKSSRSRDTDD